MNLSTISTSDLVCRPGGIIHCTEPNSIYFIPEYLKGKPSGKTATEILLRQNDKFKVGDKTPGLIEYEKTMSNTYWWMRIIIGIGIIGYLWINYSLH